VCIHRNSVTSLSIWHIKLACCFSCKQLGRRRNKACHDCGSPGQLQNSQQCPAAGCCLGLWEDCVSSSDIVSSCSSPRRRLQQIVSVVPLDDGRSWSRGATVPPPPVEALQGYYSARAVRPSTWVSSRCPPVPRPPRRELWSSSAARFSARVP